jgi:hypothetical protein
MASECIKGHPNSRLEKTAALQMGAVFLHKGNNFFFIDRNSVYPNALPEIEEMGRRVQPNPVPGRLEHRREQVAGRSLAVGAPYVDAGKRLFRMVQGLHESLGFLQVDFVVRSSTGMLKYRKLGIQPSRCLLKSHAAKGEKAI